MISFILIDTFAPEIWRIGNKDGSIKSFIKLVFNDAMNEISADAVGSIGDISLKAQRQCEIRAELPQKIITSLSELTKNDDSERHCIPLILCEARYLLKTLGILCPYEFVVECKDFLLKVNSSGKVISQGKTILKNRIKELWRLYGNADTGITIEQLRTWFAGLFRRYLFLDETVHGTSGNIDMDNFENNRIVKSLLNGYNNGAYDNPNATKLAVRFDVLPSVGVDSLLAYKEFLSTLYPEYFEDGNRSLKNAIISRDLRILQKIYTDSEERVKSEELFTHICPGGYVSLKGCVEKSDCKEALNICIDTINKIREEPYQNVAGSICLEPMPHEERLPRPYGDRSRYVAPSGKLNLLLIDDHPEQSPLTSEQACAGKFCREDTVLLRNVFNVECCQVKNISGVDIFEWATNKFREYQENGLSFDVALIDLCLKDDAGGELSGYTMIKKVKKYFPHLPIVVYSKFRDMEHIARAFWCGARWFLRKGEENKLPRHILSMLRQPGWHGEWQSIKTRSDSPIFIYEKPGSEFAHRFDRKQGWKYLTYKCLEFFPGRFINVRQMGGGISTAVTFKATKGIVVDDIPLQTPSIVKIDTAYNTMMEFERYFRFIRPYMANEAGRIELPERVLNRGCSSIVYTFAGRQDKSHELKSMNEMLKGDILYESSCDYEKYRFAFDSIFDEILPKINRVSPAREFGEAEQPRIYSSIEDDLIKKAEERRGNNERVSGFPNLHFGETTLDRFYESYVARMQPWEEMKLKPDAKFQVQPKLKEVEARRKTEEWYTFLGIGWSDDGTGYIEAYGKEKRVVRITGPYVDHVVRFRTIVNPGATLWIKQDDFDRVPSDEFRKKWLTDRVGKAIDSCLQLRKNDPGYKDEYAKVKESVEKDFGRIFAFAKEVEFAEVFMALQDVLISIARTATHNGGKYFRGCEFKAPLGIVHGDLNYGNVMLESRIHPPKDSDPDTTRTVRDVWLIDFARTRRDLITHDFNVIFTATIALLFEEDLMKQESYVNALCTHLVDMVHEAITSESKSLKDVPDFIKDNKRFSFVYKILRRIRSAALRAKISKDMYTLTTAIACLYASRIYLNHGGNLRLVAGLVAISYDCFKHLRAKMDQDWVKQLMVMGDDGKFVSMNWPGDCHWSDDLKSLIFGRIP